MDVDIFAPGIAETAVLVSMRVTGLVVIAPVFSAKTVPTKVKTAFVVLLTIVMMSAATASTNIPPKLSLVSSLTEILIGFAIGFGVAVLVGAAEIAGDLLSVQIGLSGASLLDPLTNTSSPVLANFFTMLTVTILLALNVHLGMITAIANSFSAIPVGSSINIVAGIKELLSMTGALFVLGLRFAAPVLAVVMIGNAVLAILARVSPQLNMLSVAFPLQIGIGLLALGVSLPYIATFFASWPSIYDEQITNLFRILTSQTQP